MTHSERSRLVQMLFQQKSLDFHLHISDSEFDIEIKILILIFAAVVVKHVKYNVFKCSTEQSFCPTKTLNFYLFF